MPCPLEPIRVRPFLSRHYVRRVWNTGEGLPQSSVRAIAQSDQGYLWVATSEGLVRFDGVRMEVLDRKSTPALPSPNIGALLHDGDAVWAGLKRDGLLRLQGSTVERWTRDQGLPGNSIQALARTRNGTIWACTSDGLGRLPARRTTLRARGHPGLHRLRQPGDGPRGNRSGWARQLGWCGCLARASRCSAGILACSPCDRRCHDHQRRGLGRDREGPGTVRTRTRD